MHRVATVVVLTACSGVAVLDDTATSGPPDAPPTATVTVGPPEARWDVDDLVCTVDAADPDGDPVAVVVAWTVDGRPWLGDTATAELPGDTVPAGALSAGSVWRCTATAIAGGLAVFPSAEAVARPIGGNLLLVIADDLGVDKVDVYGEHPLPPRTPTIDALAAEGVLFRNAYAAPSCTPARAALLTGLYASRVGLGTIVDADSAEQLDPSVPALPGVLAPAGYTSAHAGKWHLSGLLNPQFAEHPGLFGFASYAGSMNNLKTAVGEAPDDAGYFNWQKNTDGTLAWTTRYATTDTVDDAIAYATTLPEPWFVQVGFNAPHIPLHWPPDDLHGYPPLDDLPDRPARQFDAMVEAMDTELQRLLDGLGDRRTRTTIVFIGDNGTPADVIRPPWDETRGKGTLYEGGVRVPMIVTGPAVIGAGESEALVHAVDVLPTFARLAGVDPGATDGVNLVPALVEPGDPTLGHDVLLAERLKPNGYVQFEEEGRTVRDGSWKLIRERFDDGGQLEIERLFFLDALPWTEGDDLLSPGAGATQDTLDAYARLAAALDALESDLP